MSSRSPEADPPSRHTRWVDPRNLITRANVRTAAEPDPELVASVQAGGIIHPPVVYPDGDQLVLIAGHRRTDTARTAIDSAPQLTLEQAGHLADWGTDQDAVTALLAAADQGPVAFEHARARLQSRRDAAQRRADAAALWAAAGYQVFDGRRLHDNTPDGAVDLTDLADAHGTPLATTWRGVHDSHAQCPGRAVLLTSWGDGSDVRELCTDPTVNGHTRRTPPAGATGNPGSGRSIDTGPDRATVMSRNRDWKAATGVRQNHVAALVKAGTFTPGLVTAVHAWLLNHRTLDTGEAFLRFTAFRGAGRQSKPRYGQAMVDPQAPAHRVNGLLLAAAASAAEESLGKLTWRYTSHLGADWLTLLVEHTGYQLADGRRTTHPPHLDPTAHQDRSHPEHRRQSCTGGSNPRQDRTRPLDRDRQAHRAWHRQDNRQKGRGMTTSRRLDHAYRQAHSRGLFTGPAWTVLLITGPEPGAPLVPFEVHARTPHLAQIAAAAVLRSPDWSVVGVIPGNHPPVAGSRIVPAAQLTADHPELHAAAVEVADATLAASRTYSRPHTSAAQNTPGGRLTQPARTR